MAAFAFQRTNRRAFCGRRAISFKGAYLVKGVGGEPVAPGYAAVRAFFRPHELEARSVLLGCLVSPIGHGGPAALLLERLAADPFLAADRIAHRLWHRTCAPAIRETRPSAATIAETPCCFPRGTGR